MTSAADRLRLVTAEGEAEGRSSGPAPSLHEAAADGGEAGRQIVKHVVGLRACVRALTGDSSVVEDIVHETVAEALEGWRRYDPTRDLGAWLRGIAVHLVHRHWRKAKRGRAAAAAVSAVSEGPSGGSDPETEAAGRRQAAALLAALDGLTPKLREAFVLRVVEGLPAEEVARLTGTSPAAIHTRVFKARGILAAAIGASAAGRTRGTGDG